MRDDRESKEAHAFAKLIPPGARVLELGPGHGSDARYFARRGFVVTCVDISANALTELTRENWTGLHAIRLDIAQPLPFTGSSFHGVYARLSLHYFTDKTTREIFQEISRVLRPNGSLFAMCKNVHDSLYGQGDYVEPDMYTLDGYTRHFFSEEYMRLIIAQTNGLRVRWVNDSTVLLSSKESSVSQAYATRFAQPG